MAQLQVITKHSKIDKTTSVAPGDYLFYVNNPNLNTVKGSVNYSTEDPIPLGPIFKIEKVPAGNISFTIKEPHPDVSLSNMPSDDDLLMFAKAASVANTSLVGYYAEIKLKNNSTEQAELFSLGSEITPSSK